MNLKYAFIILIMILLTNNVNAQRVYKIFDTKTGSEIDIKELVAETKNFDVIFFGEFHDDSLVHVLQEAYLKEFFENEKNTVVSMEMFERDVQEHIDSYLSGNIDEVEFIKQSRAWRNYETDYKPLVELVKENDSYLIAANVPRKYASIFAKGGKTTINKLPAEERIMIATEINLVDDDYKKEFFETMASNFAVVVDSLTTNQDNTLHLYYGAQIVKDETMGESIVNYLKDNNDKKIIHFTGSFHSAKGLGTVQKVRDRNPELKIAIISPAYVGKDEEFKFIEDYKKEGDFIIALEAKPVIEYENFMRGHMDGNSISKHDITITLDPKTHNIKGRDVLKFKNPIIKSSSIFLLNDLKIESLTSPNGDFKYEVKIDGSIQEIIISYIKDEIIDIDISYSGNVYYQPDERNLKQKHAYSKGMISSAEGEGVYLPAGSFYPYTEDDMADFTINISFPEDIDIITSGIMKSSEVVKGIKTKVIETEIPADNLTLVGGKYVVIDTVYDGITFNVYQFEKSRSAKDYLNAMIEYYDFYTELFGKYPYSNFSLVENFFATGFGMPGYTLLSGKLLKMPWIVLSPGSLAHEFCHNWWGNSVYNSNTGNWCEALTTFSTNYYYNVLTENDAKTLDWRRKALIAIENLPEESNYPLQDFMYQKDMDDAVVGYSKGAFLFYEFYKIMGKEHFFAVIKKFAKKYSGRRASWTSLKFTFNGYVRKNELDVPVMKIFNQWLREKDIPNIALESVNIVDDSVTVQLKQDKEFYISVPIRIISDKDTSWHYCTTSDKLSDYKFKVTGKLISVELDPLYQSLRRLNRWEIPFTFKEALNSNPLVVLPSKNSKDYAIAKEFVDMLNQSDYKAEGKSYDEIEKSDWQDRSLIVLSNETSNPFFKKFKGHYPKGITLNNNELKVDGKEYSVGGNMLIMNFTHPKNEEKAATVIAYSELESAEQFRRLFHYLSYSMVMVAKKRRGRPVVSREIYPLEPENNPMRWENK